MSHLTEVDKPHVFQEEFLSSCRTCSACNKFIFGLHGYQCESCGRLIHKKCLADVKDHCLSSRLSISASSSSPRSSPLTPQLHLDSVTSVKDAQKPVIFDAKKGDFGKSKSTIEVSDKIRISSQTLKKGRREYSLGIRSVKLRRTKDPATLHLSDASFSSEFIFPSANDLEGFITAVKGKRASGEFPESASTFQDSISELLGNDLMTNKIVLLNEANRNALDEELEKLQQCHDKGLLDFETLIAEKRAAIERIVSIQESEEKDPFELAVDIERVTKKVYDFTLKSWTTIEDVDVQIDTKVLGQGTNRIAYRLIDHSQPKGSRCCVAKVWSETFKDDPIEGYYVDAEMQSICTSIAATFNKFDVPKKVAFVPCWVIVRQVDLPEYQRTMCVEPYIIGDYKKFTNNAGWVSPAERATPQAFTHFSHHFTNGQLMVVDIQGIEGKFIDYYTDPQIHTSDGNGFGVGNLGQNGFAHFFRKHRCNSVCKSLGLPIQNFHDYGTQVKPRSRSSVSMQPAPVFRPSDYCRKLKPERDSATVEDLGMLNMTMDQFNSLVDTFCKFDINKSGDIDKYEALPFFRALGFKPNASNWKMILKFMDKDDNECITFMEFLLWWTGQD